MKTWQRILATVLPVDTLRTFRWYRRACDGLDVEDYRDGT